MEARMSNPAFVVPGAMQALQGLSGTYQRRLPATTIELVNLRASQVNGCSVCVEMHAHSLREQGFSEEKVFAVGAWRESPYFTEPERAALALAEAVTRISDRADPVPDVVWEEAARHYGTGELGALVLAIAGINVWNRLNVATRQVAGPWTTGTGRDEAAAAAR